MSNNQQNNTDANQQHTSSNPNRPESFNQTLQNQTEILQNEENNHNNTGQSSQMSDDEINDADRFSPNLNIEDSMHGNFDDNSHINSGGGSGFPSIGGFPTIGNHGITAVMINRNVDLVDNDDTMDKPANNLNPVGAGMVIDPDNEENGIDEIERHNVNSPDLFSTSSVNSDRSLITPESNRYGSISDGNISINIDEIFEMIDSMSDTKKLGLVDKLLNSMNHGTQSKVACLLEPMLQRDFIGMLPAKGTTTIAEKILTYLDAEDLSEAKMVSKIWRKVIYRGYLWKRLIENKIKTDSMWRGLAERELEWGQYFERAILAAYKTLPMHSIYTVNFPQKPLSAEPGSSFFSVNTNTLAITAATEVEPTVISKMEVTDGMEQTPIVPIPASISSNSSALLGRGKMYSLPETNDLKKCTYPYLSPLTNSPIAKALAKNIPITIHRSDMNDLPKSVDDQYFEELYPQIVEKLDRIEHNWQNGLCKKDKIKCNSDSSKGVYCLQYDNHKIVSGLRDNTIKIFDRHTREQLKCLSGHAGSVLCLQYDSQVIITGSSDSTVRVWDVNTGESLHTINHHSEAVLHLRFANGMMVTCSKDRSIAIWDMITPKKIEMKQVIMGHRAAVNVVDFDERYIVSASGDRTIKVWNTDNKEYVRTLAGHRRGIACLQYRYPTVVSGSSDNCIRLWNIDDGKCCRILEGHEELVRCIRFDDKRIVSGAYDGRIKVWDLKAALDQSAPNDGTYCIKTLSEHTGRVFRLQFDEFQIVSSSHDDTIIIWDFLNFSENEVPIEESNAIASTDTAAQNTNSTATAAAAGRTASGAGGNAASRSQGDAASAGTATAAGTRNNNESSDTAGVANPTLAQQLEMVNRNLSGGAPNTAELQHGNRAHRERSTGNRHSRRNGETRIRRRHGVDTENTATMQDLENQLARSGNHLNSTTTLLNNRFMTQVMNGSAASNILNSNLLSQSNTAVGNASSLFSTPMASLPAGVPDPAIRMQQIQQALIANPNTPNAGLQNLSSLANLQLLQSIQPQNNSTTVGQNQANNLANFNRSINPSSQTTRDATALLLEALQSSQQQQLAQQVANAASANATNNTSSRNSTTNPYTNMNMQGLAFDPAQLDIFLRSNSPGLPNTTQQSAVTAPSNSTGAAVVSPVPPNLANSTDNVDRTSQSGNQNAGLSNLGLTERELRGLKSAYGIFDETTINQLGLSSSNAAAGSLSAALAAAGAGSNANQTNQQTLRAFLEVGIFLIFSPEQGYLDSFWVENTSPKIPEEKTRR